MVSLAAAAVVVVYIFARSGLLLHAGVGSAPGTSRDSPECIEPCAFIYICIVRHALNVLSVGSVCVCVHSAGANKAALRGVCEGRSSHNHNEGVHASCENEY